MFTNERDGYWHFSASKGSWHNYPANMNLSALRTLFIYKKTTSSFCTVLTDSPGALQDQATGSQDLQAQYSWLPARPTAMATATSSKARQDAGEETSWEEKLSARCHCWEGEGGGFLELGMQVQALPSE